MPEPEFTKTAIVRADLEDKIRTHVYPIGSKLPSGSELTKAYKVSMQPVRDAIRYLETIGLVRGISGSGVWVISDGQPPA